MGLRIPPFRMDLFLREVVEGLMLLDIELASRQDHRRGEDRRDKHCSLGVGRIL